MVCTLVTTENATRKKDLLLYSLKYSTPMAFEISFMAYIYIFFPCEVFVIFIQYFIDPFLCFYKDFQGSYLCIFSTGLFICAWIQWKVRIGKSFKTVKTFRKKMLIVLWKLRWSNNNNNFRHLPWDLSSAVQWNYLQSLPKESPTYTRI